MKTLRKHSKKKLALKYRKKEGIIPSPSLAMIDIPAINIVD